MKDFFNSNTEENKEEESKVNIAFSFISDVQDLATQFQIWHWNTREFKHLVTGETYDAILKSVDELAEAFIVITGKPYSKKETHEFDPIFESGKMKEICNMFIIASNDFAEKIPDEGIKGILGNLISTLRTAIYKIG